MSILPEILAGAFCDPCKLLGRFTPTRTPLQGRHGLGQRLFVNGNCWRSGIGMTSGGNKRIRVLNGLSSKQLCPFAKVTMAC